MRETSAAGPSRARRNGSRLVTLLREIVAYFVVPYLGLIVVLAALRLLHGPLQGRLTAQSPGDFLDILWFIANRIPIAHFAAVVVGVPAHMVLLVLRLTRWWHYAASGTVIAAGLGACGWYLLRTVRSSGYELTEWLAMCAVAGLLAALLFWVIVFWRNPWFDRVRPPASAARPEPVSDRP